MKKIINRTTYNTVTASQLAKWSDGDYQEDLDYMSETLYKTPKGDFFLYGAGDPFTKYADGEYSFAYSGGQKIIPMTEEEAKRWAMECLEEDEYDAIFRPVDEEGESDRIKCAKADRYIDQALYYRMEDLATDAGEDLDDFLRRLIDKASDMINYPFDIEKQAQTLKVCACFLICSHS